MSHRFDITIEDDDLAMVVTYRGQTKDMRLSIDRLQTEPRLIRQAVQVLILNVRGGDVFDESGIVRRIRSRLAQVGHILPPE